MKRLSVEWLPLRAASDLRDAGYEADHVIELDLQGATNQAILDRARQDRSVVITRDSDFHMLLASSQATAPSVVRIRAENLGHADITRLIVQVIQAVGDRFEVGVVASATSDQIRVHDLPIGG